MSEEIDQETAPNEFVCSISQMVMVDPVLTSDGTTYEREYIQNWLKKSNISPKTNVEITNELIQNKALKMAIRRHNQRLLNVRDTIRNKRKILKLHGVDIQRNFPELTDPSGFIQVEKLYEFVEGYQRMRQVAETMRDLWESIQFRQIHNSTDCPVVADLKSYKRTSIRELQPILSQTDSYEKILSKCEVEEIKYLIVSADDVKNIKLKRMKQSDLKIQILKGIRFDNVTVKEIKRRIRDENSLTIKREHQIRMYKSDKQVHELFNNASFDDRSVMEDSEYCRIQDLGKKLISKSKMKAVDLKKEQFFIVEYYL